MTIRHLPHVRGPDRPPPDGSPPSDRELWARSCHGDRSAFDALFERHVEALWNQGRRLTASWDLAEDVVSATFLTAWRRRNEVVLVRDSALPWLLTAASNHAHDERRRSSRLQRVVRRLPPPQDVADHADAVAERLDGTALLQEVLAAVRRLPRAERQAVELCLLGGLGTADAAAVLGVAEPSVRSRISRARSRLRTGLPFTSPSTLEHR